MIASYVVILYNGKRVYITRNQPTIHAYPRPLHIIHIITCPTHFPTETSKPLKSHKFCAIQRSSDHTTRECHFILYGPWQNVCGKLLPCLGIQFYCFAPLLKVILDGRGDTAQVISFYDTSRYTTSPEYTTLESNFWAAWSSKLYGIWNKVGDKSP